MLEHGGALLFDCTDAGNAALQKQTHMFEHGGALLLDYTDAGNAAF